MTLYEIIEKAKTKKHTEVDVWTMADRLGLDSYNIENVPEVSPITQCYFIQWLCTDSYVGGSILFFNEEPVAVTSQQGRKCDLNIEWLSSESYYKVYNYVKSFTKEKHFFDVLSELDKQAEWGETYSVEFTGQLLPKNKQLFYNNERVEFLRSGNPKDIIDQTAIIKLSDGSEKKVDVSDLMIEYFNKE